MKPTIGRIVLYHPRPQDRVNKLLISDGFARAAAPHEHVTHPAIVCFVHSDTHVNLAVFDSYGVPYSVRDVELAQGDTKPLDLYGWCEWMPYQKAVAAGEIHPTLHAGTNTPGMQNIVDVFTPDKGF